MQITTFLITTKTTVEPLLSKHPLSSYPIIQTSKNNQIQGKCIEIVFQRMLILSSFQASLWCAGRQFRRSLAAKKRSEMLK